MGRSPCSTNLRATRTAPEWPGSGGPVGHHPRHRHGNSIGDLLELLDLDRGQRPPLAELEALQGYRTDSDASQAHHLVAELGEHAAHLAILTFGEHHLKNRRLALVTSDPRTLGTDLPFGEPDPFGQLVQDLLSWVSSNNDPIELLDPIFGVSELVGELTVVGQKNQSDRHLIKATDGVDPLGEVGHQVDHAGSARGISVGRDVPFRLIDREVHRLLDLDRLAVDLNVALTRVNLGTELANHDTIDTDPTLEDQLLTRSTRAEARMGEDLLKPIATVIRGGLSTTNSVGPGLARRERTRGTNAGAGPAWTAWSWWARSPCVGTIAGPARTTGACGSGPGAVRAWPGTVLGSA